MNSWRKEKHPTQTHQWRKDKLQIQDSPLQTAWTLGYLVYPLTGCNHLHPRSCGNDHSRKGIMLRSWALPPIFHYFPPFISALSVTCSPLVPSCATRTTTKSPDKSPDGSPDYSAVRYHMPSLHSPQHSAVSLFNPLWIASSLPCHDRLPAHDGAILRTASS